MSSEWTRRRFLKVGALATAATVMSGCTVNLQRAEYLESYVKPPEEGLPGEHLWYASTCRQCPAGCGVIVRVSNGRARKIEGNPLHPLNRGRLCARGQAALQELYDPDRLRNAVKQFGGRGSAQFAPIYWEEALQTLGSALAQAAPGGVAFLAGNASSHLAWVANRFLETLGHPPLLSYSLGDEMEGRAALAEAGRDLFGAPVLPLYDIAQADVVFSFGANFLETWLSPVAYSRAYAQMRRGEFGRRGYVVQFESRCSSTAASADEWVRVKPGAEGLAALALGRLIAENGHAEGEALRLYGRISVGEMSEACGVPVEELERLARLFASAPKPVAMAGGALAGYQNTAAAVRAVHALNWLRGRFGQPGGVYLPARMDAAEFPVVEPAAFERVAQLIDDMQAGKIRVLLIHSGNPVFELPLASEFQAAMKNVSLVVSFSPAVDETAVQADLVLPDHTNLEGWGYHVAPHADRRIVSGQQPVMRPLYDTRATADVLLALAQMFGGQLAAALPWRNEADFLKEMASRLSGDGNAWAAWRQRGGWWTESPEPQTPPAPTFNEPLTPVGPTFTGSPVQYPLYLYPYLSVGLYDGRGANKSWLQELADPMTTVMWQTWVEMHPETARGLGLKDGDVVRIVSGAGEAEALVYTSPGIGEGVVAMPLGRGHEQYGRFARGHGANPARLIMTTQEGQAAARAGLATRSTRVRLIPVGTWRRLAQLGDREGVAYLQGERKH